MEDMENRIPFEKALRGSLIEAIEGEKRKRAKRRRAALVGAAVASVVSIVLAGFLLSSDRPSVLVPGEGNNGVVMPGGPLQDPRWDLSVKASGDRVCIDVTTPLDVEEVCREPGAAVSYATAQLEDGHVVVFGFSSEDAVAIHLADGRAVRTEAVPTAGAPGRVFAHPLRGDVGVVSVEAIPHG